MDAVHFKVRDDGRIMSNAAYVCLGIIEKNTKISLEFRLKKMKETKFWLSVCNELRIRGAQDVLLACVDGLAGLPDAIKIAFPEVDIQIYIV